MIDVDKQIYVPEVNPAYIPYGIHKVIDTVISSGKFTPIYIYGASGYGKTLTVQQVCAKHNREFMLISITSDTTDENLIGSETLVNGNLVWKDGPLTLAARRGAIVLLDEVAQATEKIMVLQEVMQKRRFLISRTGEYVTPKDGFMIFASDNTKGFGDFSNKFIGARPQNIAFLERFYGYVEQSAPSQEIEQKILKYYTDDTKFIANLAQWAASIRKSYKDGASEYEVCTRRLTQITDLKNVFNDDIIALNLGLSMFDDDFKDASIELYKSIVSK